MALAKDIVRNIKHAFVGEYRAREKAVDKKIGWLSTRSNIEGVFAASTTVLGTLGMWAFIATGTVVSTLPLVISLVAMTTISAGAAVAGIVANTLVNHRTWKAVDADYATGKLTQRFLDEEVPRQREAVASLARMFNRDLKDFSAQTEKVDALEKAVREELDVGKSFAQSAKKPSTAAGRFLRNTAHFIRDLKPV